MILIKQVHPNRIRPDCRCGIVVMHLLNAELLFESHGIYSAMTSEPDRPEAVIAVNGLTCQRGGRIVLDDLSFRALKGERVRLAGPNGSGKTTLLKTLAGVMRPSSGVIDIKTGDIAYCGHNDPVKPRLTVEENIRYWLAVHGMDYRLSALSFLGLEHMAGMQTELLSEGERRRLALTSALASGCSILLMDEPISSLDNASTRRLAAAIHSHCDKGGTVLYSSHGQDELGADRTIHLAGHGPT